MKEPKTPGETNAGSTGAKARGAIVCRWISEDIVICRWPSSRDQTAPATPPQDADEDLDVESVRRGADAGDQIALLALARIYDFGKGLPMDKAQAVAWYRKAADQGNPEAQFELSCKYTSGHGVPQDSADSLAWLRKAADLGHVDAQFALGRAYQLAEAIPRDDAKARFWLGRAAEQGHSDAQYFIDKMAPGYEKLERELKASVGTAAPSVNLIRETLKYLEIRDEIDGKEAYEKWVSLRPDEQASFPSYEELTRETPTEAPEPRRPPVVPNSAEKGIVRAKAYAPPDWLKSIKPGARLNSITFPNHPEMNVPPTK